MASGGLTAQPLTPGGGFNWVFLVELLVCGILTLFFLFYFNRLFATLVSYGIRAYTWHRYRAYIDIQALQISLLGGRIFFKSIRYHGHNQTILIHGGHITWRYWLRKVKEAEIYRSDGAVQKVPSDASSSGDTEKARSRQKSVDREEKGGSKGPKDLPCRISVKVSGVEAFVYNRSPAYDAVLEAMTRKESQDVHAPPERASGGELGKLNAWKDPIPETSNSAFATIHKIITNVTAQSSHTSIRDPSLTNSLSPTVSAPAVPAFSRLLPVYIECKKAAAVLGNENTKTVITAKVDSASGEIDAGHAGLLDAYKLLIGFEFIHPVIYMRPNHDFKALQLAAAARLKDETREANPAKGLKRILSSAWFHPKQSALHVLRNFSPKFSKSVESIMTAAGEAEKRPHTATLHADIPGQTRWQGLTRYLDDSQRDEHSEWDSIEYAKSSMIADCSSVGMKFYWDIPGPVPSQPPEAVSNERLIHNDINGSLPPEYGLDLILRGGTVNYGPWADRQRANLQTVFFPASYTDSLPAARLAPGAMRVSTIFKLFLNVEDDLILRIPLREPSKDWKWKERAGTVTEHGKREDEKHKFRGKGKKRTARGKNNDQGLPSPDVRPFAWLDIKVFPDSTVTYNMDMIAGRHGYKNRLDLDVRRTEISSSVNHGLLWRAGRLTMDCDLSNPLQWNALRMWSFNISSNDLELFILRDHLFLLTDLVGDWGSGPPPDYYTFVPFQYLLHVDFHNFRLYLNTNDSNIINNPADLDDNNFVILRGQQLHADLVIPLDTYRPIRNEITFDAKAHDLGLELCVPTRNTLNTFVGLKKMAKLGVLTLKGGFNYFTETSASVTDTLTMDIRGTGLSLQLYGFLVRYFKKIKDNYFGEDLHFKTLEEYQGVPAGGLNDQETDASGQPAKKANDLDVILCIGADHSSILLPANLYTARDHIRIEIFDLAADLRFTSYYMDLVLNSSPLSISSGTMPSEQEDYVAASSNTQVFVDALNVFGHNLFGLSPTEPSYVCNWDLDVGNITGGCSSEFLERLAGATRVFAFSLDDHENALPIVQPVVISDIIFLRVKIASIRIWLDIGKDALLLSARSANVGFNDWAGTTFSQRLKVVVPDLTLACVDGRSASRHRTPEGERQKIETHAFVQTTLLLNMVERKIRFPEERQKQQSHVMYHDQRTNRTPFLLLTNRLHAVNPRTLPQVDVDPPAMILPPIPCPIVSTVSSRSSSTSVTPIEKSLTGSQRPPRYRDFNASSSRSESKVEGVSERPRFARAASSQSLKRSIRSRHQMTEEPDASARTRKQSSQFQSEHFSVVHSGKSNSDDEEREQRGLPPSTMAFSSPFASPYFPLDMAEPDLEDVPILSANSKRESYQSDTSSVFDDASNKTFDESVVHTSFLISTESGIRAFCKPHAIEFVANLLEHIHSKDPEGLLDGFQTSVMTEISDLQRRKEGRGKSIQLSLRLPCIHLRVINVFVGNHDSEAPQEQDQYDLVMNQLTITARSNVPPKVPDAVDSLSLHLTLDSLTASVKEKHSGGKGSDVAIQADVDDVLLWMVSSDTRAINVSFRDMGVATASKKIEYLSSLIHRTTLLGDEAQARFAVLSESQQNRLTYLAYSLTVFGGHISDPPFLTRASYVLRAANDHFRNHDSWKIISRFRYIYHNLPEERKKDIAGHCSDQVPLCPPDAESRVVASWDQWRSWDLAHVKKSLAMRQLYGDMAVTDGVHDPNETPLSLGVRSAAIRFIIDPGPKQTELGIDVLSIILMITPPSVPSGLMLLGKNVTKMTIVQIDALSTALRLNWEIVELAENVTKTFLESTASHNQASKHDPRHAVSRAASTPDDHSFQIVFATSDGSIALSSINLRHVSSTKGLKASVVGNDRRAQKNGLSVSGLLNANAGNTELHSRSRMIWRSKLDSPSLYVAYDTVNSEQGTPDSWKIAGASKGLDIEVKEDIHGIIEVVDALVNDEVTHLYRMSKNFPKKQGSHESISTPKDSSRPPRVNIALLMDAYRIELALLHPLAYSLTGKVARIFLEPDANNSSLSNIDFDVGAQAHRMLNDAHKSPHAIATLGMPPISGHVGIRPSEKDICVNARGTVETIIMEAAAIHALLTTLNRPEISNVIVAIKADVAVVKRDLKKAFPETSRVSPEPFSETSRPLIFDVHATVAGLRISTSAPGKSPGSTAANLSLVIGAVQFKAANRMNAKEPTLPFPEIRAQIQQIDVALRLSDRSGGRPCGNVTFAVLVHCTSHLSESGISMRDYRVRSPGLEVNVYAETASTIVDVINHLQDKIKDLDLSKEVKYLRRLRQARRQTITAETTKLPDSLDGSRDDASTALFDSAYSLELLNVQVSWVVGSSVPSYVGHEVEDLVLSLRRVDLSTRRENGARLTIEDLQLQMSPRSHDKHERSLNSALLPEMVFNVAHSSTRHERRLAFHAAGKSLDLRLESQFVLPASVLERSISLAFEKFRAASATWQTTPTSSGAPRKDLLGSKKLSSLLVDADFAGAVVFLQGREEAQAKAMTVGVPYHHNIPMHGRYGQFAAEGTTTSTTLRAPGIALKVEYKDGSSSEPSLNGELKVDASSNTIYPTVVPLIMEISRSIKEVVRDTDKKEEVATAPKPAQKFLDEESLVTADPSAILGKTRLNLGLRICRQEFSLSCQPIARVAATTQFEDIYVTVNTIKSTEHGHFFALSAAFTQLQASVQHVYSRESTFSFDVESIVLSLMNSKHLSGKSGISAILKINPMKTQINAKQLQDFLLFREIWIPPELRQSSKTRIATPDSEPQEYLVQRYQQVAAAAAFPWTATVAVAELAVELDLGQAIGKSSFTVSNFWVSSTKSTNWEQNLCIGVEKIGIDCIGRMSGFVDLRGLQVRTSITWPSRQAGSRRTPLIQASLGFARLRVKAAFDYQAFAVVDITAFDFLMYNVRNEHGDASDRLVAILDGDKVFVFLTTVSAAQALGLYQAFDRLIQEKQLAYTQSLKDIEKFLRRKSTVVPTRFGPRVSISPEAENKVLKAPISLHTDVVVTLRSINVGAFPSTFFDHQILKLEATDVQARFAVALEKGKIHSGLGMTLGQLRVALASAAHPTVPKTLGEVTVEEVVNSAAAARGGTILRVPKLVASMQTWQEPESSQIDYIFKSSFEGKVDVGWNYSRISYIRNMWTSHARALASRLGKPLPESALRITAGAQQDDADKAKGEGEPSSGEQEKITALLNVPQSRYEYRALETPIIETPQLRDMGEATPPLEWIGLHRERLPNVTHQIIIVTLLEVAKEVEDAYSRILGSS